MLPGVGLARRRRVHYHGDVVAGAGEHHAWHHHQLGAAAQAGTGVVGAVLAARIRLEEKLRGAAAPSSSPSRRGRRLRERDGRATSTQQNVQLEEQQQQILTAGAEPRPATLEAAAAASSSSTRRTPSRADLCAVCLDEVRERHQRITRLPCSHKYHSDCVLPWLAIQPDCPCCRTLVPSVDTLS